MRLAGRKRMGFFAALLSALVLMSVAVVGFAQGGPQEGPRGPRPPRGDRDRGPRGGHIPFLRGLDLTEAQRTQIRQIAESFRASTKELHEKMRALRESERGAMNEGAFNEAAVRSAAQARAAVQVELEVARARMLSQVYNVLTAEQKAQIAERRQQFEERRRQRDAERPAPPDEEDN